RHTRFSRDWSSDVCSSDLRTFAKMRDALAATGRPILYSINPNSIHEKTGPQRNWGDIANIWRTTEDITNVRNSGQTNGSPMGIQNIVDVNVPLAGYAAPGQSTAPDLMAVGRGGMTDTEMRSHFAPSAIVPAPRSAGNAMRRPAAAPGPCMRTRNQIETNQDRLGLRARQVSADAARRVLAKRLSGGDVAGAPFNRGGSATTISTTASAIGL